MAFSMKALGMRLPASAGTTSPSMTSFASCCPRASFTTAACRPSRLESTSLFKQQPFARANHSFSTPTTRPFAGSAGPVSARLFASAAAAQPSSLNWDTFFKLRLRRRRIQLLFSVTTGLIGGAAGAIVLAEGFAEPLIAQIPLDPFVTLGLMTMACAGMGWLIGPTIGNQVFYIINRRFKSQMMQKESEFFARVKKHRVNPTNSSASNPVPDFYGEKIQSVSGYRRWLKDQRAFNKKKTASFV